MEPRTIVIPALMAALFLLLTISQSRAQAAPVNILLQHKAGDAVLHTGETYQNAAGEAFRVRTFKYYVSHIQFIYQNQQPFEVSTTPHLVNEADSLSKHILLSAPQGTLTGIRFLLGIDSLTNTAGVQTGDLDPAKGMFWVWNTGYIMAKLEGASAASKAPGKQFGYDIGGYKKGENAARYVELLFSHPVRLSSSATTLMLTADILHWFAGKNLISIAKEPLCHSPGTLAGQIADNYATMFSLEAANR